MDRPRRTHSSRRAISRGGLVRLQVAGKKRSMKAILIAATIAFAAETASASAVPVELWQTTGLKHPESARPDPTATFAYVSNVNGQPLDKDGNGFISKVSLKDGKVLEL